MTSASVSHRPQRWGRLLMVVTLLLAALSHLPTTVAAAPGEIDLLFNSPTTGIAGSGFTTVLGGTNAPVTAKLAVADGALQITATSGDLPPFGAGQDNALAIQYSSSGLYTIGARLLKPMFAGPSQSAGIYIGESSSRYIRLTAGYGSKGSTGERIELAVIEKNGRLRTSVIPLPAGTLGSINTSLDLFLNIDHTSGGKIAALYRIDSDDKNAGQLATSRNMPRWLRGGSTSIFAGVISTNRGSATSLVSKFDWFRLTNTPQVTPSVTGVKTVDRDGITNTVNPGEELTYTISVANNGATTGVYVTDPIPVDTTFVAGSATDGAIYDSTTNQVLWQNAALAAGPAASFSFKVKINSAPLQSATIVNTAALTTDEGGFPALLSDSTVVGATPDLSDSTYAASPALIRPIDIDGVTYTLNLLNDGTAPASGATALLFAPAGTTLVANSAQATSGSLTVDTAAQTIAWSAAAPLPVDGTVTISFVAKPGVSLVDGAVLGSKAIVQSSSTLPVVLDAQATYSVASSVAGTKTVDKTIADPGALLTYTISVKNNGGAAASNIQVVDPIPQDTTYQNSLSTSPGAPLPSYQVGTNRVVWAIPTLAATQTMTMSFKVKINTLPLHSSVIANKATLTGPASTQSLLAAATVVRGVADLSGSVYAPSSARVGLGGTTTYTLNLLSNGTAAAAGATAKLTIPAGMTLEAGSAAATSGSLTVNTAPNTITWNASGPLPIGTVVRISFRAKVASAIAGSIFTSRATLQATGTLPIDKIAQASFVQAQPDKLYLYLPITRR
jgi:uncharacterized repeat protein (TIGR01451 family)